MAQTSAPHLAARRTAPTQTRFTCTLTKTDEPAWPSHARVTISYAEGASPPRIHVTPWPPLTASPVPALTGPTPKASTNGNARPSSWPKSEANFG